jgi:4-hydroxy-tetrahydrodipicolinate synthase
MRGIIAAVPTPVEWTGAPLRALFVDHCLWALDHGCDGLNVLGSTGEAASFDAATRRDVMGWRPRPAPWTGLWWVQDRHRCPRR